MGIKTSLGLLLLIALILGIGRSDMRCQAISGHKTVELNFWNGFTGPDGRIMLGLVRKFNDANPDILVSMQRMDWATYYNKLMVAAVDGRGPEVFVLQSSSLPRMHRAGFVSNVTDLFQGPNSVDTKDFDQQVITQVRYGKDYIGLPLDIWPFGLYCNADMLRAAGFVDSQGHVRAPANRAEFVKAARVMQHMGSDGRPDVWGYALTNWRMNYQSLLPQFDGHYFSKDGKADLANEGNVAALTFLQSLNQGQRLIPPPENGLGWVGYRQKKVGMVIDGIFMVGDLQRLEDFNYVGFPIPVVGNHAGTMAESHVLCVRSGLDEAHQTAAKRFLHFLSDNSIDWAKAGQVPARISVRANPEFKKMPVQSAFAEQIPNMVYLPKTTIIFEMNLELDLAVEKVIRGRATPIEALKVANDHVQAFLDRDKTERTGEDAL